MSLETILSIIGLGLSFGAFVPLLLLKDRRREIAVIALLSVVCVVTAYYVYQRYQYDKELQYVRKTLLVALAKRDLTYEDMQQQLGDIKAVLITDVIRKMLRNNEIFADVVTLHSSLNGQSFDVRLYRVTRIGIRKR